MKNTAFKRILFFALLLAFLTGCQLVTQPTQPAVPASATPTQVPTTPPVVNPPEATPTEVPALPTGEPPVITVTPDPGQSLPSPTAVEITSAHPTEVPEPTGMPITPKQSEKLSPDGPWLVIQTSTGLFATNEDGTGLTRLTTESPETVQTVSMAASPDGRTFAYITGNGDRIHGLQLNLMTLPEGESKLITALTNPKTEPGTDAVMDAKTEAVRAITDEKSVAWSPDGKTLAFIGVQIGPSADLYTYSPATGKITRLTDGPSQAYGPSWSPDGKYIVQYGVTGFGTGAGYSMAGAWAARADGSAVIDLGKPGGAGEKLVGWLDKDSFVTYSWTPVCGPQNLRVININDKSQNTILRDCFSEAAMAGNGALMVVGSSDMGNRFSGISIFGPGNLTRRDLSSEGAYRVSILPDSGEFRVDANSASMVYSFDGTLMSTSPHIRCGYTMPVGTFGMIYGWACGGENKDDQPGVWINGPGIPEQQIFNQPARAPTMGWHNALLFFSGSTMYRADFFAYVAAPVARLQGDVLDVMWVRKNE